MTQKKEDIKIPQALLSLRPGAQWVSYGDSYGDLTWLEPPVEEGGQELPTQEEVEAEVERLRKVWEDSEYQRLRAKTYPSIVDQLDLLYHGGLDSWKAEINKVKEQYPKPE